MLVCRISPETDIVKKEYLPTLVLIICVSVSLWKAEEGRSCDNYNSSLIRA
jgi:hypothetical protein